MVYGKFNNVVGLGFPHSVQRLFQIYLVTAIVPKRVGVILFKIGWPSLFY